MYFIIWVVPLVFKINHLKDQIAATDATYKYIKYIYDNVNFQKLCFWACIYLIPIAFWGNFLVLMNINCVEIVITVGI